MTKIGLMNIAVQLDESYIKAMKKREWEVVLLTERDLEQPLEEIDAILIYDKDQQAIGETCSCIMKIKEQSQASIWIVSQQTVKANCMIYLQLGANGNLCALDAEELWLILRNNLLEKKQSTALVETEDPKLSKVFKLIPGNRSVLLHGRNEIILTNLEYRVLELLYTQPKRTISYEEICQQLWGKASKEMADYKPRIANLVFHVREKIEKDAFGPKFIKTVRAKGYRFNTSL